MVSNNEAFKVAVREGDCYGVYLVFFAKAVARIIGEDGKLLREIDHGLKMTSVKRIGTDRRDFSFPGIQNEYDDVVEALANPTCHEDCPACK